MANRPDLEKVKQYVLHRLEKELPATLTYHGRVHTFQEVVPAADLIATLEKISDEERLLVLTAAYFHDLGFIYIRDGHEAISIKIAEQTLPGMGYSEEQIGVIRGIIQATCLPQSPTNLLEMIMADADLDYLGHEDFWKRSNDFRTELENYGTRFTEQEWFKFQLNFMQTHKYFTPSARHLRDDRKRDHLAEIAKRLAQLEEIEGHTLK